MGLVPSAATDDTRSSSGLAAWLPSVSPGLRAAPQPAALPTEASPLLHADWFLIFNFEIRRNSHEIAQKNHTKRFHVSFL